MSRCYPYPPPGYTLNQAKSEALIESIKLQKEKEIAKEQKRKEKKEKKLRKKEKKEKRKEKKDKANLKLDKSDLVKSHNKKISSDAKAGSLLKGRETETEQLERSSVTEENEHPVCLRVPTSSSDSTENSNKRKRQSSPSDGGRPHGKIIRIRLSSKKQTESKSASAIDNGTCSTSGRTGFDTEIKKDSIVAEDRQENVPITLLGSSSVPQNFALKTHKEQQVCSTSRPVEASAPVKSRMVSLPKAVLTPMQKEELLFKDLIVNWGPPQMDDACNDSDLDWLLNSKNSNISADKRQTTVGVNDGVSCSSSSGLWPRAQYLDGVDIYALPFTVPY